MRSLLPGVGDARVIELQQIADSRGDLVVIEVATHLPFTVARVFSVLGTPDGTERGHHAHRRCTQALVALSGTVEVRLDDGGESRTVVLDDPAKALLIPAGLWATQIYRGNALAQIYCDRPYEEADYLRDYNSFLAWRAERIKAVNPDNGVLRLNLGCGGRNDAGQCHANYYTEAKLRAICAKLRLTVESVERFLRKGERPPMIGLVAIKN